MIIIPARLKSSRLPDKPLVELHDKPLLQYAVEAAKACYVAGPIVVTDEPRIQFWCERQNVRAHCDEKRTFDTGTDRIAAFVKQNWPHGKRPRYIINLQCDEPDITPSDLAELYEAIEACPEPVATLVCDLEPGAMMDRNTVKVVYDGGRASRFSREFVNSERVYQHVGAYAFKVDALLEYHRWPRSNAELEESLEQLRFLDHAIPIAAVWVPGRRRGINSQQDVDEFLAAG